MSRLKYSLIGGSARVPRIFTHRTLWLTSFCSQPEAFAWPAEGLHLTPRWLDSLVPVQDRTHGPEQVVGFKPGLKGSR